MPITDIIGSNLNKFVIGLTQQVQLLNSSGKLQLKAANGTTDAALTCGNLTTSGALVFTPQGLQAVTTASTITASASAAPISASSTIATFTSTPLIAAGTLGQQLEIANIGSNNITFSDYTNSGTAFGTPITMQSGDTLQLAYLLQPGGSSYAWQPIGGSAYVRAIATIITNASSIPVDAGLAEGRLTLNSGVPVPATDTTGASTIYYTPYKGDRISLWNGTVWQTFVCSELSISISSIAANTVFDIFCYLNGSTPTLELSAWSNTTTRATNLARQNGVLVKSTDTTRRFLGTACTFSTAGQTQCTFGSGQAAGGTSPKWGVSNYQNAESFTAFNFDSTSSWTYGTAVWRAANNSTNNRFTFVNAVQRNVSTSLLSVAVSATGGMSTPYVGISLDATNGAAVFAVGVNSTILSLNAVSSLFVYAGQHYIQGVEYSSNTSTYYGNGDYYINFNFSA